ncbi:hypothetical protein C8R44DRAFT_768820 [Mycena epipterygia]|nr:hypothetical protein C8R44DRAFT_768820 [Mycena epipterygia]
MGDANAHLVREIRIHDCLHLLGITLMYWDHLVTLDNEIGFVWKRARSASAYWFFAIRYSGFAGNLPVTIFSFYTVPPKWCHAYHVGHQVVLIGTQLVVSIVLLLRMHALYGRNLRLLGCLLAISALLLAAIFWSIHDQKSEPINEFPGCHVSPADLAVAWEALFVFDAMIFALTVFKTCSTRRRAGDQANLPIHTLILRDGAPPPLIIYYTAMAFANLCNILTFYPILSGSLSTFASCMSVAMMSRLMINLHEKADAGVLTRLDLSFQDDMAPEDGLSGREINPETQRSHIPP